MPCIRVSEEVKRRFDRMYHRWLAEGNEGKKEDFVMFLLEMYERELRLKRYYGI